ncbi:Stk1 family PASTA domain-containing Ser/Thr kinase [Clostridium ganghwense]|uniref:non-specific serine/threonine protein kinase n=1 Tax=Clostridium ganghwense TaxID=312089 RepID=A0ABT4CTW9_9CLOT|nr:Stk1 family PASTA domain-containing Ser/Thr kinase [Clostridium ganghwense]MCY6372363.1 Stk1 family PASTA domain-containing Ser/Thr kinase [Clostridium ganghwense]
MIGAMLGNRYELLEKIGEGGMAEVYKAKCHLLNRFVAVKILKNQYSDNVEFVDKFKQEAASAASLSHNNIVGIYDIGSENSINYIVMEYIDGKTLKQIINEQKVLKYNEAIMIAIQIAKALECAHNNNIIHRDVKPHNILVTREGIIKVTDFGIAKATSSVTITNSDRIIGSAHYFSPEQAKGSFVDCKTDIYSLGIIIYEMVTGRVPYDAESPVSVALKHIQEPVIPPKEINPDIPESLNTLILKAIEKEQYKRYQKAQDILLDLEKIKQNPDVEIVVDGSENEYTRIMKPINESAEINDKFSQDEEDEYLEDEGMKISGKTKKIIVGSLAALAIVIIGFVSAFVVSQKKLSTGSEVAKKGKVTVPNIIDFSKEKAQKEIEALGLRFVTTSESSDKPKGVVIKCYPVAGTEIDKSEQDEIRAIVSSGPRVSAIPNLFEIEFEEAKGYLKAYNLNLGKVSHEYSNVEKGRVCKQSPEAGTEVGNDNSVDLVVSKGPEVKYVKVPNLINKNFDEAADMLDRAKLKLGSVTKIKTSDESLDGIVSVQSIKHNSTVKENTSVNISYYVYSDKGFVIVPNFVNKTVEEAKKIAKEYNLNINVKGNDDFIITYQDKVPGKEVLEGTTINLKSEPNP